MWWDDVECFAGTICRIFDHDRRIAGAVSDVCGWRLAGAGGKCLEYGILWVFFGCAFDLAADNEARCFPNKNYGGIHSGMHFDVTMRCVLCHG